MDTKHVTIVKSLYQALGEMDWSTYEANIHPEFRVVEAGDLPFAGVYAGIEGFKELVSKLFGMFSEFAPEIVAITSGDDHVMVWVKVAMTSGETGKHIVTELIEVFKFEGDKLIEIRPFYFNADEINAIV